MSRKVFCGGLPWGIDDNDLKSAMMEFGDVTEAKVITDRETGRSKGFGFVTFASDEGYEEAIRVASIQLDGRNVRIDQANDKPKRGSGSSDRR